jgi:enoyl-CoA hydratase
MIFEDIAYKKEEGIATITLNRPPMNPMRYKTYLEIEKAVYDVKADSDVKVLVIAGAGEKAFSAGGDISAFYELGGTAENVREYVLHCEDAISSINTLEKPTIAAIKGYCFGGGLEIACACDFRIAAEDTKFCQAEVNVGLIPGTGGTAEMARLVGFARAKEIVMLGRTYTAQDALNMGLLNKTVPREKLMDEVMSLAKELMSKPQTALRIIKLMMNLTLNMDDKTARLVETEFFNLVYMTKDAQEGLKATIEKRKPEFRGEILVESIKKGMEEKKLFK